MLIIQLSNPLLQSVPVTLSQVNLKMAEWKQTNQLVLSLILPTLIEKAMFIVDGSTTSQVFWSQLQNTFSFRSKSRELRLKDALQTTKKGILFLTSLMISR